jgi:hypothetical protein
MCLNIRIRQNDQTLESIREIATRSFRIQPLRWPATTSPTDHPIKSQATAYGTPGQHYRRRTSEGLLKCTRISYPFDLG